MSKGSTTLIIIITIIIIIIILLLLIIIFLLLLLLIIIIIPFSSSSSSSSLTHPRSMATCSASVMGRVRGGRRSVRDPPPAPKPPGAKAEGAVSCK
jgi:hypothetical protein